MITARTNSSKLPSRFRTLAKNIMDTQFRDNKYQPFNWKSKKHLLKFDFEKTFLISSIISDYSKCGRTDAGVNATSNVIC